MSRPKRAERKLRRAIVRFCRRNAEEIRDTVPDRTPAQERQPRRARVRLDLTIDTHRGDSLLVLADALCGAVVESATKMHKVRVRKFEVYVDGKPVYDRYGKVRKVWL